MTIQQESSSISTLYGKEDACFGSQKSKPDNTFRYTCSRFGQSLESRLLVYFNITRACFC